MNKFQCANMAKANMTDWEKKHIAVDHLVGFERPDDTSLGVSEIRPEITPSFLFIWR